MRSLLLSSVALVGAIGCGGGPPGVAEGIFAPLGEAMPFCTPEQRDTFERGKRVGLRRFTSAEGFGPTFNVSFCMACHERPTVGGGAARYRNFLLVRERLGDGSLVNLGVNGVQDQFALQPISRLPTDDNANVFATRNAIPMFGVGLFAELPEREILSREDPDDADGDGISGRANFDRGFVSRFGMKAQTASIEGFIR
jgi:CxxC motif-containing protein (DUF1111 family)